MQPQSLVRHVTETETAIDDMVDEYIQDGRTLIKDLERAHRREYDAQVKKFKQTAKSLVRDLSDIREKSKSAQKQVVSSLNEDRNNKRKRTYEQQVGALKRLKATV